MYYFIFYFIYKSQINQTGGAEVARYIASLITSAVIIIHIGLIYSIIRFVEFRYFIADISFNLGKSEFEKLIYWLLIFIPIEILIFKYFDKQKIIEIGGKYNTKANFYSFSNILKLILIITLPLIFAIILVNETVV